MRPGHNICVRYKCCRVEKRVNIWETWSCQPNVATIMRPRFAGLWWSDLVCARSSSLNYGSEVSTWLDFRRSIGSGLRSSREGAQAHLRSQRLVTEPGHMHAPQGTIRAEWKALHKHDLNVKMREFPRVRTPQSKHDNTELAGVLRRNDQLWQRNNLLVSKSIIAASRQYQNVYSCIYEVCFERWFVYSPWERLGGFQWTVWSVVNYLITYLFASPRFVKYLFSKNIAMKKTQIAGASTFYSSLIKILPICSSGWVQVKE